MARIILSSNANCRAKVLDGAYTALFLFAPDNRAAALPPLLQARYEPCFLYPERKYNFHLDKCNISFCIKQAKKIS